MLRSRFIKSWGTGIAVGLVFLVSASPSVRADASPDVNGASRELALAAPHPGAQFNPLLGASFPNSDSAVFGNLAVTAEPSSSSPLLSVEPTQEDSSEYAFNCPPSLRDCVLVSTFNLPNVQSVSQTALVLDRNGVPQSISAPYHTPVPEPGSLILFSSAIAGLVGLFRRKLHY